MSFISASEKSNELQQRSFEFTLILSGIDEITEEIENALFEAGCDDALLGSQNGVVFLDFCRESESFLSAAVSAIRDVQRADIPGLQVAEVQQPNTTEINLLNTYLKFQHFPEVKQGFDRQWDALLQRP